MSHPLLSAAVSAAAHRQAVLCLGARLALLLRLAAH